MVQTGRVVKLEGGKATVAVVPKSACGGNCASCSVCGTAVRETIVWNPLHARCGQTVKIELPDGKLLALAFLTYLSPLFCALLGYALFRIVGAVIGFFLPFICIFLKRNKISEQTTGTITEILS